MSNREKNKPLVRSLVLGLALILVLSACGGQGNFVNNTNNAIDINMDGEADLSDNDEMTESDQNNDGVEEDQLVEGSNNNATGDDGVAADTTATVSYEIDVEPILISRCATCHGGDRIEGQLVLLTYDELMAGGKSGAAVVPGDAEGSKLVELMISGKMPKRGPKVTPVEIDIISNWVNQGALNN
jgi:hypothetical protein